VLQVHLAQDNDQRRQLYEFRYKIHVEELGLEPPGTYHKLRAVRDDFDVDAQLYYISDQAQIAGSFRVLICDAPLLPRFLVDAYDLHNFSDYKPATLSLSDQFIIDRSHREGAAASVLQGVKYKKLREQNIKFDFCSVAPALVPAFVNLGYRRYHKNYADPTEGLRTPMVLVMEDAMHLREVHSPFAMAAAEFGESTVDTKWLCKNYPLAAEGAEVKVQDEQALWQQLTIDLHQSPLTGIPLFKDMEVSDAQRLIKNSVITNLSAGEMLVEQGDDGNEMFIILSGYVEVRKDNKLVTKLGPGNVIGEIGFLSTNPRTADVLVIQDGEFLVLTQDMFRKAMKTMPELAAQALFNLSLILCERLQNSTQSWVDGVTDVDSVSQDEHHQD